MKKNKNNGRFKFILGFVMGATIFGTATAFASGVMATRTLNTVIIDGEKHTIGAYNIDGRNYFQLRHLGDLVGFNVGWDENRQEIIIDTGNDYGGNYQDYSNTSNNINSSEDTEQQNSATPNTDIKQYNTDNIPKAVFEKDYPIWCDENYQPYENELEVIRLVNEEREKAGLNPVTINMDLCKVARIKAVEMVELEYFSHDSPNYGAHTEMVKKFDIDCNQVGENIARLGGTIPKGVMSNWMSSEGHRQQILNQNHKEIGIGVVDNEGVGYWSLFLMY